MAAVAASVNFDGLAGPTHNYAGLSPGNLASEANRHRIANPRQAALEGLAKMKALADRGFAQAVLPPHERPDLAALRTLGFSGSDGEVLRHAAREAPALLAACSSAAAMWAANAATVSASSSTRDGKVHFSPANLNAHFHRALEAPTTTRVLRALFADGERFVVHEPLPSAVQFGDEGAANHMRLRGSGTRAVEIFVWGREAAASAPAPRRFPARQTLEASTALARRHGLSLQASVLLQQHPDAIDAGAFHNDVVAVAAGATLLCHEKAFADPRALAVLAEHVGTGFRPLMVPEAELTLAEAVSTYLFNSQLLERPEGGLLLLAPAECRESRAAWSCLQRLLAEEAIQEVMVIDLRQSMRNGGGPACLRLQVPLTDAERGAVGGRTWLDATLYQRLTAWVNRRYRDRLAVPDLADPALLDESRVALDELTGILQLPPVYPFQR